MPPLRGFSITTVPPKRIVGAMPNRRVCLLLVVMFFAALGTNRRGVFLCVRFANEFAVLESMLVGAII